MGCGIERMASRQAFTDEEWKAVLGGVFMVGFAVTASQPSGFLGMLKEGVASRRALAEASKSATANTLIKTVASALRSRSGRKITNAFTGENLRGAKQEELKTRAIAAV